MAKRVLIVVAQPCIFCEATLYESALWRDDETGAEEWSNTPLRPHRCTPMEVILQERAKGGLA